MSRARVWIACAVAVIAAPASMPAAEELPFPDAAYPWSLERPAGSRAFAPEFESPQSTLRRLERAHVELDLATYASILSADYRFLTEDPRMDGRYPEGGVDRTFDIRSTAGMFGVVPMNDRPRVTSIDLDFGLVGEGPDPEHPDSTDHYRLLIAPHPTMELHVAESLVMELQRSLQAFHLVRGDAAVLPPGAPANASHWYVRRWVDTPDLSTESGAEAATPARAELALSRNPTSEAFEVQLAIPETGLFQLTVFDVAGRQLRAEPETRFEAGRHTVRLAGTRGLAAGIYWLRLTRDGRTLVTRAATRL